MNIKECINEFNKYAKNYDLKVNLVMDKYHHSFRVMELCNEIALSLNLNEEDVMIANICGLFHDIGRFNQWVLYETYKDSCLFDHGDEGEKEIQNKELIKDDIKNIVLMSAKYHNKYSIDKSLDERTKLFCNIVRDADKLDIIKEQCIQIYQDKIILKKEMLNDIYNKRMCQNKYTSNDVDSIIRMIGWVFDYNFKYSYQFLLNQNIIKNKFDLLEMYGKTEEIDKLKDFIYKEIEKRC